MTSNGYFMDLKCISTHIYKEIMVRGDITDETLTWAMAKGMLMLDDLVFGHYYFGYSQNAHFAYWNGDVFVVSVWEMDQRAFDEIDHPENDEGFDIFVPVLDITRLIDTQIRL